MYTSRDLKICRFVEAFGCATSRQLKEIFFPDVSYRRFNQRMTILASAGRINRERNFASQDYLYFMKKPKEIEHMLQRVNAYIDLSKIVVLNEFIPEYQIGELRADAYFEVWNDGKVKPYFLEVQRSPYFRQEKYESVFYGEQWRELWERFPTVIILTNKQIRLKPTVIKFIIANDIKKTYLE